MLHKVSGAGSHLRKYSIPAASVILISGVLWSFLLAPGLVPDLLIYLGIFMFVFDLLARFIRKKKSMGLLARIMLVLSLVNIVRHYPVYVYFSGLLVPIEYTFYFTRELIWLIPSWYAIWVSLRLLIRHDQMEFDTYLRTTEFKIMTGLFILMLLLELPLFGFHGGFDGTVHGHGFWDAGTHIH